MGKSYWIVIARHPGETAWSIFAPAFSELASSAPDRRDVTRQAREALETAIEFRVQDGEALPSCFEEGASGPREVDAGLIEGAEEVYSFLVMASVPASFVRLNISMDSGLLSRVDEVARRSGKSRSAILADGARLILAK